MAGDFSTLPIIDVGPLVTRAGDRLDVAAQIARACRESGLFYIVGHGVDDQRIGGSLQDSLESFLPKAGPFENARARGLTSKVLQQRVGDKVGVAKEALVDAPI